MMKVKIQSKFLTNQKILTTKILSIPLSPSIPHKPGSQINLNWLQIAQLPPTYKVRGKVMFLLCLSIHGGTTAHWSQVLSEGRGMGYPSLWSQVPSRGRVPCPGPVWEEGRGTPVSSPRSLPGEGRGEGRGGGEGKGVPCPGHGRGTPLFPPGRDLGQDRVATLQSSQNSVFSVISLCF